MPIQRIFLDWSKPALKTVAQQLILRSCSDTLMDLSHLIVVFPGSQAGRRFLELLVEEAGGNLCPPEVVTVGRLPELLYEPQRPFASLFVQQLVWARALQNLPPEKLQLLIRQIPDRSDQPAWLRLGDLLRRQHEELGRDQLDFEDVWKRGASLEGFDEVDRWKLLAEIQRDYWQLLDGYQLWDQQTARLEAIKRREIRTEKEIVTVGTVDLNRTLRAMLDQIADQVTSYVQSAEERANDFDAYGCLISDRWAERHVDLRNDQLQMAEDSAGQCAAVIGTLTSFEGKYALEEITVGLPDPSLVLPLQRTLEEYGVASYWPVACVLSATGPYRLLQAVADFLDDSRSEHFAALVRHPDVSLWLSEQDISPDWLTDWDKYFASHLPRQVDWLVPGAGSSVVLKLKQLIGQLLSGFPRRKMPLSSWSQAASTLLQTIYGQRVFDSLDSEGKQLIDTCQHLEDAFEEHANVPLELDSPVSAGEAIRLTLDLADGELYRGQGDPALQLAGWLELPLDDAPVAIVTTFNESFVPKSLNHDLFLPNRLRVHLGIEDNLRRYARDLYVMTILVQTREELRLIISRRDATNDPLAPSRLLFATDPQQIAERVLAFYDSKEDKKVCLPASPRVVAAVSDFPIPRPVPRQTKPETFRVTEFRDYLASPYRYYLRHVLKLSGLSDEIDELDGAAFGMLIHEVLKRFGQSEIAQSVNAEQISDFLKQQLQAVIVEEFGEEPLATISIQAEQAERRLHAFAQWQAEWCGSGWEIRAVEWADENPVTFPLGNGESIQLKGRIDRIDFHPQSGRWAIFDYKTGDAGTAPEKTHRYQEEWQDLQLPLYRHLARGAGVSDDPQLGYIVLPRDTDQVKEIFAEWSQGELESADEVARDTAKQILDEDFWHVLCEPPSSMQEFDEICQVGVFGQENFV